MPAQTPLVFCLSSSLAVAYRGGKEKSGTKGHSASQALRVRLGTWWRVFWRGGGGGDCRGLLGGSGRMSSIGGRLRWPLRIFDFAVS